MCLSQCDVIASLAAYRRPGTPVFARHFLQLPAELIDRERVPDLITILVDESLPSMVRDNAAGALGEIGDEMAVEFLVDALASSKTRRGAAVAIGRMRASAARESLAQHAPNVPAARWALSELGVPGTPDGILEDLRKGSLHGLRTRIARLDAAQAREAESALLGQLSEKVEQGTLTYADAWIVSGLYYLQSRDAEPLLAEALLRIADPDHAAAGLRSRVLRSLSELGTLQTIPLVVEFLLDADSPIHKDLAAACVKAIARRHGSEGVRTTQEHADQIGAERQRLAATLRNTPLVDVERPWHSPPGSPKWAAATKRTIRKLDALLGCAQRSGW